MLVGFFFFRSHHMAYGILVPQPGIKPMSPSVEAWILNHCTTREVPEYAYGCYGSVCVWVWVCVCVCVCWCICAHAHRRAQSSRNNLTERLKPGAVHPVHFTTPTGSQMQNKKHTPCFMMEMPPFTLRWTNWRWNKNELWYHLPALPVKRLTSEQGREITVMTQ